MYAASVMTVNSPSREDSRNRYRVLAAALVLPVVALIVRLLFIQYYAWHPYDSDGYVTIAHNLIAGNGFSRSAEPPYEPTLFRTPVYPFLLVLMFKLFGSAANAVFYVQAILGTLTCVVVYFIAREYFSPQVAYAAAILNAVSPLAARFVPVVLTETSTVFLLACAVLCWCRARTRSSAALHAAAGALIGLTILCRPEWMFLPIFALAGVVLEPGQRSAWRNAAIVLAMSLITLMPWLVRNYLVVGRIVPLIDSGPAETFWQSAHPEFDHDAYSFVEGAETRDPVVADYLRINGEQERRQFQPEAWMAGVDRIRRAPLSYLARRVRDYSHMWVVSGDFLLGGWNVSFREALRARRYGLVASKFGLLAVVGVLPIALAVRGIYASRRRLIDLFPLWIIPLYISLARVPFDIEPRHALPAQPYLLIFAAAGLAAVYQWFQRSRESTT